VFDIDQEYFPMTCLFNDPAHLADQS
jgi:hypothetical protein